MYTNKTPSFHEIEPVADSRQEAYREILTLMGLPQQTQTFRQPQQDQMRRMQEELNECYRQMRQMSMQLFHKNQELRLAHLHSKDLQSQLHQALSELKKAKEKKKELKEDLKHQLRMREIMQDTHETQCRTIEQMDRHLDRLGYERVQVVVEEHHHHHSSRQESSSLMPAMLGAATLLLGKIR